MAFSYRFTASAEADLDETLNYIAVQLHNTKAASDFADKLTKSINDVCLFPENGSLVKNEYLPNTNVRKKHVGNYIMYYLPDFSESIILILRLVYSRRDITQIDLIN